MSVEREQQGAAHGEARVGVDLEPTGALVARTGAREAHVVVPAGSTIADVVRAWGARDGHHVRLGLLAGDRLRSDVLAVRVAGGREERLAAADRVRPGDAIRLRFRD